MSQCKSCGKQHEMVLEHKNGKCEPLDMCYQCIFKDWKPRPVEYVTLDDLDENSSWKGYGEDLMKAQDEIIRDMIISDD